MARDAELSGDLFTLNHRMGCGACVRGVLTMERHPQTYRLTWQGIEIEITYDPASFGGCSYAVAHLAVHAIAPDRAQLPITETGYRSHHLSPVYVEQAGGPIAYVLAWLDAEAQAKR